MLFKKDQRELKSELHELIDTRPESSNDFLARMMEIMTRHKFEANQAQFAAHTISLIYMGCNAPRAHKLIDNCIRDIQIKGWVIWIMIVGGSIGTLGFAYLTWYYGF